MNLARLFHTLRHLRAEQIVGQVSHRVRRVFENPLAARTRPVPPFPGIRWKPVAPFEPACTGANSATSIKSGEFTFLNRTEHIGFPPDWNRTDLPKLWRYNLHYHDFLWLLDRDDAMAVVKDWIERAPAEAWEPYPTSLRLMNWLMLFHDRIEPLWPSIYRQAEWLSRHLETHLLGNHLLENAAALAIAGSCFDGSDATRWLDAGSRLLRDQLDEQILPDGGHFERSPMYHARIVYVLRQLRNTQNSAVVAITRAIDRATRAMNLMCHPDGEIALLNDSAFGIHPAHATEQPIGPFLLPDTGYFGARTASGDYIICDAGPIGPDYQPGHAHGDILSFELSLRGHRVITDTGVHDYERGPMRDYVRSTAAHNTVELFGRDQCEFWSAFRVGRRARITRVDFQPSRDGFELTGEHDGYRRVYGKDAIHRRKFVWHDRGEVVISDCVTGRVGIPGIGNTDVVIRFHLHPDCTVTSVTERDVLVRYAAGNFVIRFENAGTVQLERTKYCPEFGLAIERTCVRFSPAKVEDAMSGIVTRIAHV